jgi:hypothetical protein
MPASNAAARLQFARPEFIRIDGVIYIRVYVDAALVCEYPVSRERIGVNAVQCVAFLADNKP